MKVLLHICCGNCAALPVQVLRKEGHRLDGFWFNPNIHPVREYELRRESLRDLAQYHRLDVAYHEPYVPEMFFAMFPGQHGTARLLPSGAGLPHKDETAGSPLPKWLSHDAIPPP
ncbi:MAG: hypothetical protein GTO08_04155, partial [Deltaproteobacteria bacterium]|nr:hypothetical protein [Deltaproteobacteria bacterium]